MSLVTEHHDETALVDSLSPRERQLLDMATNGLTDQAIANELGISLATVSTYWGRIRIKFGPLGRTEIVARFLKALMARANADLTASEAKMRTVLEASPVGIFLMDAEGLPIYVNAAYSSIAGKGEQELVQGGLAPLIFPGDRLKNLETEEETGYGSEHRWEKGDGTIVWVRLRSDAWYHDGVLGGRVGVVEDVTVEHEARERQTEAEERYHLLFALAPEAIVSVDESLKITGFNASAEKMFRYTLEEILGQPLVVLMPESFREHHASHMEAFGHDTTAVARPMAARSEVCGLTKDGQEFPCEASIVRQVLNGKPHYTAIVRDVSDRIRTAIPARSLDGIPLAAWKLDEAGRLTEGNDLLAETTGQSLAKLTENRPGLIHPDDQLPYADQLRRAAEGGSNVDVRVRIRCGPEQVDRWHLCRIRYLPRSGWLLVATDIHQLEIAADELRRVKAILR